MGLYLSHVVDVSTVPPLVNCHCGGGAHCVGGGGGLRGRQRALSPAEAAARGAPIVFDDERQIGVSARPPVPLAF
jgi:hypothetical protein